MNIESRCSYSLWSLIIGQKQNFLLMGKILHLCLCFYIKKIWTQLCSWSRSETRELFWRVFLDTHFECYFSFAQMENDYVPIWHMLLPLLAWGFWPFWCIDIAKILPTLHLCWNTASFKWNIYVYCSSLAFWIIYQYIFIPTHVKQYQKALFFPFFFNWRN